MDWAKEFPDKRKEQLARLYVEQKGKNNLWRQLNPEKQRAMARRARLKRAFGLTVEQYDAMFEQQQGCCAICQNKTEWRRLAVDHCHETGKVRALLCSVCNNNLGIYEKRRHQFEAYLAKFGPEDKA